LQVERQRDEQLAREDEMIARDAQQRIASAAVAAARQTAKTQARVLADTLRAAAAATTATPAAATAGTARSPPKPPKGSSVPRPVAQRTGARVDGAAALPRIPPAAADADSDAGADPHSTWAITA
jgi:hypothetical protein